MMKWYLDLPADQLPGVDLSRIAVTKPLPEAPKPGSAADKAIEAIKDSRQAFCIRTEYLASVTQAILDKVSMWIANNDPALAQSGLNAVERLDKHFGVK
jgi:hypothetical protein